MPVAQILVPHDDGRWYVATLLGQHRDRATGRWRAGVRYTVDVMTFQRVLWADDCRRLPEQHQDDQRDAAPGHEQADHQHDASRPLVTWGRGHGWRG